MGETLVIRKRTDAPEADDILNQLEGILGFHGERLADGRRYDLDETRDWLIASVSMRAHLDGISDTWSEHLDVAPE